MHKGTCTHTLTQTLLLLATSLVSFSDTVKCWITGLECLECHWYLQASARSTNSVHGQRCRQQFNTSWRGARGYFRQIPLYTLFSMLTSFRLLDQNQFGQSHPPGWFSHSLHLFSAWGCSAWWLLAFPCQCPGFQLHCQENNVVQYTTGNLSKLITLNHLTPTGIKVQYTTYTASFMLIVVLLLTDLHHKALCQRYKQCTCDMVSLACVLFVYL